MNHNIRVPSLYNAGQEPAPNPDSTPAICSEYELPVHKNRTEFTSSDMLVPWNLKCSTGGGSRPRHTSANDTKDPALDTTACPSMAAADTAATQGEVSASGSPRVASDDSGVCPPAEGVSEAPARATLHHRYYHIFKEGELEALCSSIDSCHVLRSYYDQGNWCVVITKRPS